MNVTQAQLAAELGKRIAPIYIVSGDEPLLVQEAADQIRLAMRKAGYSEREVFDIDSHFDWEQVLFSANSMSLFAEQKILEVRMPGGKPGDKGATALKTFAKQVPEGTSMLLVLPKLDKRDQNSQWMKALTAVGVFVQIWPISLSEMPKWIGNRFTKAGLIANREAIDALIDRVEGNLLAAIQEIERLRLISKDNKIGFNQIVDGVADSSRYDVFGLIDAALDQDGERTAKIVRGLRHEGIEPLLITSLVARELRSLAAMAHGVAGGSSVDAAMQSAGVWQKRKRLVGKCLKRHKLDTFLSLEQSVGRIDKLVKGIGKGEPWDELATVMLSLAGKPPIRSEEIRRI